MRNRISTGPGTDSSSTAGSRRAVTLRPRRRAPVLAAGPEEIPCPWLFRYPPRARPPCGYELRRRGLDLGLLVLTAPAWAPVLGATALAVRADEPGAPVLYAQRRTGRHARRFRLYKLRTMRTDADELKWVLRHLNRRRWPDFKVDPDPRITRLGSWLRRTSLDELPQVLNVLRGDMTLVGPRPTTLPPTAYEAWQIARFEHAAGLTGAWQVSGRGHPSFDARVRLDLEYNRRACTRLDLEILLRTVGEVLALRGR